MLLVLRCLVNYLCAQRLITLVSPFFIHVDGVWKYSGIILIDSASHFVECTYQGTGKQIIHSQIMYQDDS